MSYYVYATFTERERLKFKTKEEALAFSKWANKKINTSFEWTFANPDQYEAREYGFDHNKLREKQGRWEHVHHEYKASHCRSISKPIKSNSLLNRLKNQFWFVLGINKIDYWTNDTPMRR